MTKFGKPARVVIIGAGMAGLHAAFELADAGVASLVVDACPRIGGVVYRDSARREARRLFLNKRLKKKTESFYSRLKKHSHLIELRLGSEVVGPTGAGKQLALLSGQESIETLDYDRLIICTGCYERATPFPGWMLPGVMMLGGAQLQVKSGLVRPGKRIVICGSGPLVPVAARQMQLAGVEIAGLCEANHFVSLASRAGAMVFNLPLFAEGLGTLAALKASGNLIQYGWGIVEARGEGRLEEVVVAPYDNEWNPDHSRMRVIQADCLATGYGFVPRTELTRLLGVEHEFNAVGHPVPVTDEAHRTSVDHVYVAGDAAGIYGGQVAAEAGRLAAMACLADTGVSPVRESNRKIRSANHRIHRLKSFTRLFPDFSHPRKGHIELAVSDTIICRCENVSRAELDEAVQQGVVDLTTLKMATRAGMGDCQGKICGPYCQSYLANKLGTMDVGEMRPRFPLVPVPFKAMMTKSG